MRKYSDKIIFLFSIIFLLFNYGCENLTTPSINEDKFKGLTTDPIINSVSPLEGFSGVTIFTIKGSNFSVEKNNNVIYFNGIKGEVQSATSTEIKVKAANVVKDTVLVKLSVYGAEKFSNSSMIKLIAPLTLFGEFLATDEPWGMTSDKDGNIYVSLMNSGVGVGIKKVLPSGSKSDYATTPGITKFSNLKLADDGIIYGARTVKAIYTIPAGGGTSSIWVSFGLLGTVFDLDVDANGNVWAGGNNTFVNSIKPDKTIKQFPLEGNIRSLKINNNYLYVAGTFQTEEIIYRAKIISADSILAWEEYFNLTKSSIGGSNVFIYGIGFLQNGDLFIGTDGSNPIKIIKADKSVFELFPGVITPTFHIFTKAPIGFIYGLLGTSKDGIVVSSKKIYKIVTTN